MDNDAVTIMIYDNDKRLCLMRTVMKFLNMHERDIPYVAWTGKRFLRGVASKHRTRSGVKYNNLMRLHRRLSI